MTLKQYKILEALRDKMAHEIQQEESFHSSTRTTLVERVDALDAALSEVEEVVLDEGEAPSPAATCPECYSDMEWRGKWIDGVLSPFRHCAWCGYEEESVF